MGNHSAPKRYVRQIRKTLPCSGQMKRNIVSQISRSVEDYLIQNPDADLEAIQAHFGTPQEIAASCMDEQDAFVLLKKARGRKKALSIIAGAMAAIFLILAGFVAWDVYLSENNGSNVDQYIIERYNGEQN